MHLIRIFGTMLHVVFKLIYFISNEQKGRHDFHFPLIRAQYYIHNIGQVSLPIITLIKVLSHQSRVRHGDINTSYWYPRIILLSSNHGLWPDPLCGPGLYL